jgi:hypothetical protein
MNDLLDDDHRKDGFNDNAEEHEEEVAPACSRPCKKARMEDRHLCESYNTDTVTDPSTAPSTLILKPSSRIRVATQDEPTEDNPADKESVQALLRKARSSPWYKCHLADHNISKGQLADFKRRFGPYEDFLDFKKEILNSPEFTQWRPAKMDQTGIVLGLLILGSLRRIRGMCHFDDMEELSAMDDAMHREFFSRFEKYRLANKHRKPWSRVRPHRNYHQIEQLEKEDDEFVERMINKEY